MTDSPRRRATDRVSGSPTFIGVGSTLTGNLDCQGDLIIGGVVIGESTVRGTVTLSEGGRWEGRLNASNVVVAGEWHGEIIASEKLEIRKSARIRGAVTARSIAVAQGAVIEGEMAVTSGAAVVHYDEKRKE
ncbi:MAG TPA: polymer-forming cytoskeletal protein [Povalibacter sp.]|jgi:cytoskeletal protein CcmA (bactofilin family)|nr:polymer-forming cytoskeletal protein [Povalibacter sp.]